LKLQQLDRVEREAYGRECAQFSFDSSRYRIAGPSKIRWSRWPSFPAGRRLCRIRRRSRRSLGLASFDGLHCPVSELHRRANLGWTVIPPDDAELNSERDTLDGVCGSEAPSLRQRAE
jgi:hypothetical protein